MIELPKIQAALRQKVQSALAGRPIYYENRPAVPPDFGDATPQPMWVEERYNVFNERRTEDGLLFLEGEATYSVFTPAGRGTELCDTLAASIAGALEPGHGFTYAGQSGHIYRTERKPYSRDRASAWLYKPVVAYWRVFGPQ